MDPEHTPAPKPEYTIAVGLGLGLLLGVLFATVLEMGLYGLILGIAVGGAGAVLLRIFGRS